MATVPAQINGRRPRVLTAPVQDGPGSLAQALLAFHAEAPKLRRDSDGQIQRRTYRYASLDGVLDDVEPLLVKHGLLWSAKATIDERGAPAALYCMTHVPSEESDEWMGPLPCVDPGPQALGSAITYMRRYTLVAYLNLAPGEDDDGAAASPAPSPAPAVDRYAQAAEAHAQSQPQVPQPSAAPPRPSERHASPKQLTMLNARARAAGLSASAFANIVLVSLGEQPRAWESEPAANSTLSRIIERLPARLVDTVLDAIAYAAAQGGQS